MNYGIFKIPVSPITKKYFEKRYAVKMDPFGYMHLDKTMPMGMKVIHYMDVWWPSWEFPKVEGPCLKIKMPAFYMNRGIHMVKLKELGKLLDAEAMDFLLLEIACAAQYPGVSVTEAIISVLSRYDISDDDYRTDTMRRQYDRYVADVVGAPFKEFRKQVNASIRVIYEKMVRAGKKVGDVVG